MFVVGKERDEVFENGNISALFAAHAFGPMLEFKTVLSAEITYEDS